MNEDIIWGETMDWKTIGAIALVVGLVLGFSGGRFSTSGEKDALSTQVAQLSTELKAAQNLQDQLVESKAQLESLNVNELYGLIKVNGEMKAYKIGDMNKMPPLIANDDVGGAPVIVSWCPLCGTLTAYDRRVDGKTLTFAVEGARKIPGTEIENLHFRDAETNSVWAQGPGLAVEGPKEGTELKSIPVQLFNADRIRKMGIEVWKA